MQPLSTLIGEDPNGTWQLNVVDRFSRRAGTVRAFSLHLTEQVIADDGPTGDPRSYSTDENAPLTVTATDGVLSTLTAQHGNPLTASLQQQPDHGHVTLASDGGFTYTPQANFSGPDSFVVRAFDGLYSRDVTVPVTVNFVDQPPVGQPDAYNTDEDTPLSVSATDGVLSNDTDVEHDPLTASLVTGPSHGTFALAPDGSFTYTPAANYHGSDSFVYQASDGTKSSADTTVTLTVNSVNDPPVANADNATTAEDTPLFVPVATGVLANDTDADGDSLTAVLVTGPSHGRVDLQPDGSYAYDPGPDFNGQDSFVYKANDGTDDSVNATVTITVTPVNDPPRPTADTYAVNEDTTLTVPATTGVLANDTDVDGDPMTAHQVAGPAHGQLALASDGSFVYTPAANYNGPDSFTYQANDGTADSPVTTVSLTVRPVNDAPVAAADSYSTEEDQPLVVAAPGVLANDTDVDGDVLHATVSHGPAHGHADPRRRRFVQLRADRELQRAGLLHLRSIGRPPFRQTATVTLAVRPVNDPPVADERHHHRGRGHHCRTHRGHRGARQRHRRRRRPASRRSWSTGRRTASLTFAANGSLRYTPAANYNGPDSFTYQANDGIENSAPATVSITVTPVDDAPVARPDAYATAEDQKLTVACEGRAGQRHRRGRSNTVTRSWWPSRRTATLTLASNGGLHVHARCELVRDRQLHLPGK